MSDLSLHIDCTYRWDDIKAFLASPDVRSAFLMNTNAEQVRYALQHCDFVVVRVYDPFNERDELGEDFEKSIVNRKQGWEFVAWLDSSEFAQFRRNKKVRFVLGWNELYSKRGSDEWQQNANIVAIGQAMVNAGYGVGLGAWASDKSFYADDVNAAHWDRVIRFAVNNKDMVSLDVHEYDVLTVFAGHLKSYPDGFPDTLKNPIALHPDNHGTIPYAEVDGNIETNYKIGRVALLLQRALDITGDTFNWYRGECALDFKDNGALKPFIDNWYKPQFGHPTGINSLLPYYRHLIPGLSETAYDELIFRQHTDLCKQDPDSCQANFIFAWNGDVNRWDSFNVAKRPYFVSLVANHKSVESQPDMPDYVMEAKLLSTKAVTNLREDASDSARIYKTLLADNQDVIEVKFSNAPVKSDPRWDWHRVEYDGKVLYVAKTGNLIITDIPVDDSPDDDTPDTPTDGTLSEAQVNAIVDAKIAALFEPVPVVFMNNTFTVPKVLQEPFGKLMIAIGKEWQAQGSRLAGYTSLGDIADVIFATQTSTDLDDSDSFSIVTPDVSDDDGNDSGDSTLDKAS